jgi:hypothetical protein
MSPVFILFLEGMRKRIDVLRLECKYVKRSQVRQYFLRRFLRSRKLSRSAVSILLLPQFPLWLN